MLSYFQSALGIMTSAVGTLLPFPVTLTAEDRLEYFPARRGQLIGPDQRYKVLRMLGVGAQSSVYFVEDVTRVKPKRPGGTPPTLAVKVLTAHATSRNLRGSLHELATLQAIKNSPKTERMPLPNLIDHFEICGPRGNHLCFVIEAGGPTIDQFRRTTPTKTLRLHVAQFVVFRVLVALNFLHKNGIVHTDVRAGNILINDGSQSEPPDEPVVEAEIEIKGEKPFPSTWHWEDDRLTAERHDVDLIDVGCAKWAGQETDYTLGTPVALRAPEVILKAGYDTKIDIWALGCLAFELLTGNWCFRRPTKAIEPFTIDEIHLALMLSQTSEAFSADMLQRAERRGELLQPDGNPRFSVPQTSWEEILATYNVLLPDDVAPAAAFIRACLHLDPERRPTAKQLWIHPFVAGADFCINYRPL